MYVDVWGEKRHSGRGDSVVKDCSILGDVVEF